jgi:uncharacterized protein (TIGR03382 family)
MPILRHRRWLAAAALLALAMVPLAVHLRAPPPSPPAPLDDEDGSGWRDRHQWLHGGDPGPEAYAQHARFRARRPARAGANPDSAGAALSWWQIGPLDFHSLYTPYPDLDKGAGRILSIAPHPTDARTLFISSVGGLFVTHDAGTTGTWAWRRSDAGLFPAPGLVAITDADPDTMFYGLTGSGVGGLFVSHDGGNTWSDTGITTGPIGALLVSGSLVVAGAGNFLHVSHDGGATFVKSSLASRAGGVTGVVQVPPQVLVAMANGQIWRSTDGGATWSFTGPPPSPVQFLSQVINSQAQPNRLYASCERNGLAISDDGGVTWRFQPASYLPGPQETPTIANTPLLAVDPTDPTKLFAGRGDLLRSVDSGATWAQVSSWVGQSLPYLHADMHSAAFSRTTPGLLYIGHDGGLSFTTAPYQPIPVITGYYPEYPRFYDSSQNVGRGDLMLYRVGSTVAKGPTGADAMAGFGAQDHGTLIRTAPSPDQLATSQTASPFGTGDGIDVLIHPVDPNLWLLAGYGDNIFKSTDGAKRFSLATTGITATDSGFFTDLVQGAEPDTVFHTEPQDLYVSTNFGDTWSRAPLPIPRLADPGIRTVVASARSAQGLALLLSWPPWGYITSDQQHFTAFGEIPTLQNAPSGMAFSPDDDDTLYVSSPGYDPGASHLWKSADHGASWTALGGPESGLPDGIPINVIRIPKLIPPLVLVGTNLGAFQSCDRGATWAPLGNGLPQIEITDLFVAPDTGFARVTTYGMGAWELRADPNSPAVALEPANPPTASPGQRIQFQVNGGAAGCYGWVLVTNGSGGSISADGLYVAGQKSGTDVVQVTEAFGRSATATVSVLSGRDIAISPSAAQVYPGDTISFTVTGGGDGAGLTWSFINDLSRGSLSDSGVYTAGPITGVVDLIQVADARGRPATASVAVVAVPERRCGCSSGSGTAALAGLWALAALARRRRS